MKDIWAPRINSILNGITSFEFFVFIVTFCMFKFQLSCTSIITPR